MTPTTVLFSPRKPAIPEQGGTLEVLLRVQAPDQPQQDKVHVVPKRLALVVDRSGSMNGHPLREALRCVSHIASRLTSDDQISVVVYDDDVDVLVPLSPMTSAQAIQQAISQVQSGGSTDLFAGWETGARQLEGGVESSISRVLLLSDGQANHGVCEVGEIERHCREWLASGVSTTTVGLGRGFNEDLMIAMARSGGGQQYFGQSAEDLYDSFDEELSLLQALFLRKLDVKLIPAPGVIVEPMGIVQQNADGSYRLSDLAWGAETWIMLRLHLSPSAAGTQRDLLAATLNAVSMDGASVQPQSAMLRLPVADPAAFEEFPADELVLRRYQEVEFALASQVLRQLVEKGDMNAAQIVMADLEQRFAQNAWLSGKLERLREMAQRDPQMMSKELHFNSMRMSRRLVAKSEIAFCVDETDSDIPAFLRKKLEEGKGRKRRDDTL